MASSDVSLSSPTSLQIPLDRGDSANFTLIIRNAGPAARPAVHIVSSNVLFGNATGYKYDVAMLTTQGCSAVTDAGETPSVVSYEFYTKPLDAGESVGCTMRIVREAATNQSIWLAWRIADNDGDPMPANDATQSFAIGSLTDIALTTATVESHLDNGIAHARVRVTAANRGPSDAGAFQVGQCFVGDLYPRFQINGEVVDGCGSLRFQPTCFDGGIGFQMPALRAGQTESCVFELSGNHPYAGPEIFPFRLNFDRLRLTDDSGNLLDTDPENDTINLILAATPFIAAIPAPATSGAALAIFATALFLIGMLSLRRRTKTR